MAGVLDGRMSTSWLLNARVPAVRRFGSAGLRRFHNREPTRTGNVLPHGLHTRWARSRVAGKLAVVIPALQRPPADPIADVFFLDFLCDGGRGRQPPPLLPASGHPFLCLLVFGTASLFAVVPPAVERAFARPRALRGRPRLGIGACKLGRCPSAAAGHVTDLVAGLAGPCMTRALASMTTGQQSTARLITARDLVGA